jgi:hypothetical protein
MAQGRKEFGPIDIQASNLADSLVIKALQHYSKNGATAQEKIQADFLVIRHTARIAARGTQKQANKNTLVSVFCKTGDSK